MTLLSIVVAAGQEAGIFGATNTPTMVIGSTDENVVRLLALAQREGRELLNAKDDGWTSIQREHTFTTVSGTAAYALPSDFDFIINDTWWDRTNHWALMGPLTPQQWQWYKSGLVQASPRERWRIKGYSSTQFYLDPTPSAALDMVWEYQSTSFCQSSGGTAQSAWAADTDTGILPERLMTLGLIWRMKQSLGLAYAQEKQTYDDAVEQAKSRDGGKPTLIMGRRKYWDSWMLGYKNVPDGNWGL